MAAKSEAGAVESFNLHFWDCDQIFFCSSDVYILAGQARSFSTTGTIYKCKSAHKRGLKCILKYVTDVLTQFHGSQWTVLCLT